jgi:hypothetical protein
VLTGERGEYDVADGNLAGAQSMLATMAGGNTWTLTITGVPVAAFQYKFTLGSWATAEETSGCGQTANRDFGFDDADASFTASDTVAAWPGSGGC